ncbi:glycerophosphodiester phosphodiesterase family protein [Pontibaca salina]|uniref:Phosphodiesterase n=1 Tax=Pontibaca salina TaxID=2795731 RepID=A0A934LYB3_9RHOB|nr:glycerophosphodiester phosphodiesterase family protein [Pontibaca salina]MBI6629577.1 phosphodiesterase [Pontibaca salina]
MTPSLPRAFLRVPLAHRALHDRGRPENSRAAIRAAVEQGFGIEIDLQLSRDNRALVFHDDNLSRLTKARGAIKELSAAEAGEIALNGGNGETVPTLDAVLEIVMGRVPLLIELKDQDGALGPNVGPLEAATATALRGYVGPVAVMAFNPHSIDEMRRIAPDLPRGLVTCGFEAGDWKLSKATRQRLRGIPDFKRVRAAFISHDARDLTRPRVQSLRARGVPVLCWTIRSPQDEARARKWADNITFEGYLPRRRA